MTDKEQDELLASMTPEGKAARDKAIEDYRAVHGVTPFEALIKEAAEEAAKQVTKRTYH
ncbi:hypothetical protein [Photobacterium angustum]|uniref:hypothetical protein n=1 Tax=Photobacterium angustum TaxID=661 RepID=UPI0015E777C2|nr:hypothetical protein [Photobacterium angustum]